MEKLSALEKKYIVIEEKLKEHEYNVAKIDNGEYLKVSAIYGANASGKTNVLQAFDYMKKRIFVIFDKLHYKI